MLGVSVTHGALTANAMVHGLSEHETTESGSPVRAIARGVSIVYVTSQFGTVKPGDTINVNAGPFAGAYKVDHVERSGDGVQSQAVAR